MISLPSFNRAIFSLAATLTLFSSMPLVSHAQGFEGASSLHGKTVMMPRGTTFEGRMDLTIGSSKSRQGQPFTISMSAPVLANGTDVLIPAGSQIIGEVVEAIPAGDVPHPKGMKPSGKLRVQLTSLRTPDGITYPLVASLAADGYMQGGSGPMTANKNLGGGIGYVGTQAGFAAVAPGMDARARGGGGQGLKVMSKSEIMRDPIYGIDPQDQQQQQGAKIRSLVKKGRDIYIASGSPVSIKLDAPFKIGISQASGAAAALTAPVEFNSDGTFGRRFTKQAPPPPQPQGGESAIAPGENPLPGILPDVPHGQPAYSPPPQQAAPPMQPPVQQAAPPQSMQAQPPGQLQPPGQAATPAKGDF
ncbi:MAG: TrbI/VirB10 family protein [Cyanobacteria bacterium SZAS-4]|nr:TrbI/VirB10 family protein [Cyanobacteria bacterium SZAS-4]